MARRVCVLGLALVVSTLASCSVGGSTSTVDGPLTTSTTTTSTTAATDGADAAGVVELFAPIAARTPSTLVVLVPGGGWATADPTGMRPLATALADEGLTVATTTYRTSDTGHHFPDQALDVACALAGAAAAASRAGYPPDEVVVVGHSAGAHLAALVSLRPGDFSAGCVDPAVIPDHLVGLAGPYDIAMAGGAAAELFATDAPAASEVADANPLGFTDRRPDLDVLLVHGDADRTVPMIFTDQFADALERGGHDVTVVRPSGVDHQSVYSAEVAGPAITAWLDR